MGEYLISGISNAAVITFNFLLIISIRRVTDLKLVLKMSMIDSIDLKTILCCNDKDCCYNPTCDIALRRLPHGSLSSEYIDCLYNIRHLIMKVSIKGWFFAFWVDNIFYDSSNHVAPLALNVRFKEALKHSFHRRLKERCSFKFSADSILFRA